MTGISIKNTVNTCKQTSNKEVSVYDCLEGVFLTAIAFGSAASALKKVGQSARGLLFPHRIPNNGVVEIVCQTPQDSVNDVSPRAHK